MEISKTQSLAGKKRYFAGIRYVAGIMNMKLRKVPSEKARHGSIPSSQSTNTLIIVHLDPEYFEIEKYVEKIKYLANQFKFNHIYQLLTGTGSTLFPDYGEKIRYWPPEGPFMLKPPGENFTIVGGYFQNCMMNIFKGLVQTLKTNRVKGDYISFNFPLEANFAAEVISENGEVETFPTYPNWERVAHDRLIPFLASQNVAYQIYYCSHKEKYKILNTPKQSKTKINLSLTFWSDLNSYLNQLKSVE
jgi:hypothetical protein